jgi:hypothetical protein
VTLLLANFTVLRFVIVATANPGAIVVRDVVFDGHVSGTYDSMGRYATRFVDCGLVVFSRCTIDTGLGTWGFERSPLMMEGSTMSKNQFLTQSGTSFLSHGLVDIREGDAWITNSTMVGQSGNWLNPGNASSAFRVCDRVNLYFSGNCRIEGGTFYGTSSHSHWILNFCSLRPADFPHVFFDPSTTIVGPWSGDLVPHPGPQTGVEFTLSPGTLQVTQHAPPSAPTLLLIGPVQTTPWNFLIGPVFLDPLHLWTDFVVSPPTGPTVRTICVPPTIPYGAMAGIQGFSVSPSGDLLTSNATIVGFW